VLLEEDEEAGKSAGRRRFYSEVVRSLGNARVRPLYFYYDTVATASSGLFHSM
jgi:hypothetical protein